MSEAPPQPSWVREIRTFYSAFPELLEREFSETMRAQTVLEVERCGSPRLWKRIGDELVFCCRIEHLDHLARCVLAFVKALDGFGDQLDADKKQLDVKGSAWIAAFPHPNITIKIAEDSSNDDALPGDFPTEELERSADTTPSLFDFLGPGIDGGFRIAKFASADRCALSVELACLLARACFDERAYPLKFFYHDRQILKGVLRDHPYPVISIDTERSDTRKDVLFRERLMTGRNSVEARLLLDFLRAFMSDEDIETPALAMSQTETVFTPPSYAVFAEAWEKRFAEKLQRGRLVDNSGEAAENGDENANDDAATEARLFRAFENSRRHINQRSDIPEGDGSEEKGPT